MELHGGHAIAHLKGESSAGIERDVLGDLADDRGELACRHVGAIAIDHVPQLDEDLRPRFRIGTTIEGGELPGLHFGDVIAALDGSPILAEHQRRSRMRVAGGE